MDFIWSDAVILLVVCATNEHGGSDRTTILSHADIIARCRLTDIEFYGGIHRLLVNHHIYVDDDRFFAEDIALDYFRTAPTEVDVEQMTEHMMAFLGITWPHSM